jgi:hypothetical protein
MLVASLGSGSNASAAPVNGGALQVLSQTGASIAGGGSATPFTLKPPSGAACTGDSVTGGYRIQTYIVPSTVSPATLTFDAGGPTPQGTGATLRQPLFTQGTPFVDGNTAVGTGAITGLPAFDFAVFGSSGPQIVPPGTYNVGIACTLGSASATQLDKYWNAQLTFAANPNDVPSGITWTVVVVTPTTTTTTSTTTTTTTTPVGTTTTTHPSTTTSTTSTSTTTTHPSTTTTLAQSAAPSSTGSGNRLVTAGSSPLPILVWGLLLLVFGRMAILVGRPVRVHSRTKR